MGRRTRQLRSRRGPTADRAARRPWTVEVGEIAPDVADREVASAPWCRRSPVGTDRHWCRSGIVPPVSILSGSFSARNVDGRVLPSLHKPLSFLWIYVHGQGFHGAVLGALACARRAACDCPALIRGGSVGRLDDGLDLHGEPERQSGYADGGPGRPADAVAEGADQ